MSVLEAAKATLHRPALPALMGIRFLAAFYVVLGHSLPWLKQHIKLPSPVEIFLTNCPLAVALFSSCQVSYLPIHTGLKLMAPGIASISGQLGLHVFIRSICFH